MRTKNKLNNLMPASEGMYPKSSPKVNMMRRSVISVAAIATVAVVGGCVRDENNLSSGANSKRALPPPPCLSRPGGPCLDGNDTPGNDTPPGNTTPPPGNFS